MSKTNVGVLAPGDYFMMGNFACVEAAILAGCRFYAGYPITPSSEIFERASVRFPQVGGSAIEMEDEVGSMAALVGASFAGAKVMTATSGPGFSLMMENIGLAYVMEAPCVVVNVQRAGPSTGVPTLVGQGDMMQAKWGSHGDLETIVYSPNSVQEFFDLTIQAFNSAEKFRTPVFVLADQVVGMMWERLRVPAADQIEVVQRQVLDPMEVMDREHPYFDYANDFIPMPIAGRGNRVNVDSLTHDSRGYPSIDHGVSESMTRHLTGKVKDHAREIWRWEERYLDDAEIAVVSYGSASRSALAAVKSARSRGVKAGYLRLVTPWPFPDEVIDRISKNLTGLVVAEINYGQMIHPVRENSHCPVVGASWAPGTLIEPATILDAMQAVVAS
jgi:2-oxoglutarate/2-oxoacid ferredoxin oxidoreductase subunit alpha